MLSTGTSSSTGMKVSLEVTGVKQILTLHLSLGTALTLSGACNEKFPFVEAGECHAQFAQVHAEVAAGSMQWECICEGSLKAVKP